ncbi:hypothetical protein I4F81_009527 [Pyropia yezoensis]|uniref:Uncharacterized protein n=1 Tax=Pyropia yezoensis TaxID=2788 RepID=A0ACC3C9U7_PYRYE|nr:hypothetical protein I4F81_009527 [Neopyropia yezoensis]
MAPLLAAASTAAGPATPTRTGASPPTAPVCAAGTAAEASTAPLLAAASTAAGPATPTRTAASPPTAPVCAAATTAAAPGAVLAPATTPTATPSGAAATRSAAPCAPIESEAVRLEAAATLAASRLFDQSCGGGDGADLPVVTPPVTTPLLSTVATTAWPPGHPFTDTEGSDTGMRQTTLTPKGATDALRAAHAASALTLPLNQGGGGGTDAGEVTDDGTGGVIGDAGGAAADTAPRDGDDPGVVPADTVVGDSVGDGAPVPTPTAAEKRTVSPRERLRSAATVKTKKTGGRKPPMRRKAAGKGKQLKSAVKKPVAPARRAAKAVASAMAVAAFTPRRRAKPVSVRSPPKAVARQNQQGRAEDATPAPAPPPKAPKKSALPKEAEGTAGPPLRAAACTAKAPKRPAKAVVPAKKLQKKRKKPPPPKSPSTSASGRSSSDSEDAAAAEAAAQQKRSTRPASATAPAVRRKTPVQGKVGGAAKAGGARAGGPAGGMPRAGKSPAVAVPPVVVGRPTQHLTLSVPAASAGGAGAAAAASTTARAPVRAFKARVPAVVRAMKKGGALVRGPPGAVIGKRRAATAAALLPASPVPGHPVEDPADGDADKANPPMHKKPRQSKKGKGPARHPDEKEGIDLAVAVRAEVSARVNHGMAAPEDADDVFLCAEDADAMYLASFMAAAPASLDRAKELRHTVAETVPRKLKGKPKEGGSGSKRRVNDLLELCGMARSAVYGALTRWIIHRWQYHAKFYDSAGFTPPDEEDEGEDGVRGEGEKVRAKARAQDTRAKAARWWLRGRRYLKTKKGRLALYQIAAEFIRNLDVDNAKTTAIHKGRVRAQLLLWSLGRDGKQKVFGGLTPSHRAIYCEELAALYESARSPDCVWVWLFKTDVDEDDCASLKDPEVTLGTRTFAARRGAKRKFNGDEDKQKETLRHLCDSTIEEESDFTSDDEVVLVTPPSVTVAPKSRDELRMQRLMSTEPMRDSVPGVKVKMERESDEDLQIVEEEEGEGSDASWEMEEGDDGGAPSEEAEGEGSVGEEEEEEQEEGEEDEGEEEEGEEEEGEEEEGEEEEGEDEEGEDEDEEAKEDGDGGSEECSGSGESGDCRQSGDEDESGSA